MPHKVKFKLLHVSGHDEGVNPLELEVHNPLIQGWTSARFCLYPQELVFKLEKRTRVRKLQILAHQFLIPSKVEIFIGEGPSFDNSAINNVRYNRLGYIALSDNEKTGFKARELKSVHVDAIGVYLKLVVYKNHVNRYNLYNQVGLVAINVIGDIVANKRSNDPNNPDTQAIIDKYIPGFSFDTTKQGFNPREDPLTLGAINIRADYISPLDDLAFDMYQDPEVAKIIRKLDKRKTQAINEERFELAKKIKQAIIDLQKVGERLGKYEVEKRRAMENEDFDLAQQKKEQMEEYRVHIQQQLEYHSLLDDRHKSRQPPTQPLPPAKLRTPTPPHIKPVTPPQKISPDPTPREPSPVRYSPPPPIPTTQYEERPLPARRSPSPIVPDSSPREPTEPESDLELEPLSEKHVREAQAVIDVFGLKMVTGAYSKQWSYREDALLAVNKILEETETNSAGISKEQYSNMLRNAIFLCRRAILDKVMAVFSAALKLLKMILVEYIPKHGLDRSDTIYAVEKTLPNLVSRTGETSLRQRTAAKDFINDMALMREVKPLQIVPHFCTIPFDKGIPTRLATGKCEIVEQMLKDLGMSKSGLTVEIIMNFSVQALEHHAKEVRDIATRIILEAYQWRGDAVRPFLPDDTENTRKNVLYKQIFEGFDRIDGGTDRPVEGRKSITTARSVKEPAEKPYHEQAQQGPPSTSKSLKSKPTASEAPDDTSIVLDNMCIFCGERSEAFNEEGLDLHYWKECPMLKRCQHCKQVVEIANLSAHLLTECDKKEEFGLCKRCTEAIPKNDLDAHVKAKTCNPAKPDKQANHCPLCHINFAPGEDGWKMHLMGKEGCKENPRRLPALNRAKTVATPKKPRGSPSASSQPTSRPGKGPTSRGAAGGGGKTTSQKTARRTPRK